MKMFEFDFETRYYKGADMPADFLSRNVIARIDVALDWSQLQELQE